jgi:hypothetical protein
MDKDLRSLIRAIEKVVASDHRIRDNLSKAKHIDGETDQDIVRTASENSSARVN